MLLRLFIFAVFLLFGIGAARADDYIKPSWPDLARTMVRFNALDLSDPAVLDEYAIVTECDLYAHWYSDDFKWHQVQQAILKSVQSDIATYPTSYRYETKLQLDRYDFNAQVYRFTAKTTVRNVNTFMIYDVQGTGCGKANVKIIPRTFRAVIADPINLDGIPLSPKDAQALLDQMTKNGNTDHIVYTRFNLRITYIDPLRKSVEVHGESKGAHYQQSNAPNASFVRLDARLGSVNFYADPDMQVLIYELDL